MQPRRGKTINGGLSGLALFLLVLIGYIALAAWIATGAMTYEIVTVLLGVFLVVALTVLAVLAWKRPGRTTRG